MCVYQILELFYAHMYFSIVNSDNFVNIFWT